MSLYLTLNLEIYSIERDDRLILLNGHKIRTKEKLIEKLAQDTDQLTLTVVDKETETIFDQHNIDITEELGKILNFGLVLGPNYGGSQSGRLYGIKLDGLVG